MLKSTDDVFDVPPKLSTPLNSELFQQIYNDPRNKKSVLRSLGKLYGKEFLAIGFLKFIADSSGFLSPILLNWVVQFMEDKNEDIRWVCLLFVLFKFFSKKFAGDLNFFFF